ncbi:hypothetical protein Tco_0111021 [Tanacetum coccineum]
MEILVNVAPTNILRIMVSQRNRSRNNILADSDHARNYVDRKSTSSVCTFMGCCLTSWFSMKQTALAISITEAKYVSIGKACQQELWMKQALVDYEIKLNDSLVQCDNKGAIDLRNISIEKVSLEDNVEIVKPVGEECKKSMGSVTKLVSDSCAMKPTLVATKTESVQHVNDKAVKNTSPNDLQLVVDVANKSKVSEEDLMPQ